MADKINHPFELKWDSLNEEEWQSYLSQVKITNYLADWAYGEALSEEGLYGPKRGVVLKNGAVVALIPASYRSYLRDLFSMTKIFRAPLWVRQLSQLDQAAVYALLRQEFKKSIRHRLMFMPELPLTKKNIQFLRAMGFYRVMTGYSSILIDLTLSQEQLRKNMKGNWRRDLQKAEKLGLNVKEINPQTKEFHSILDDYKHFKKQKKFSGPSASFIREMCAHMAGRVLCIQAYDKGHVVASTITVIHGNTATYLVGVVTDEGRAVKANNLLLWKNVEALQRLGLKKFDLGGVNLSGALGVTRFKEGLSKKKYSLSGIYV